MEDVTIVLRGSIVVDDGKGWRGDDIIHAKLFTHGLDERRLSRSHLALEGEDVTRALVLDKLTGCLMDAVQGFDRNLHCCLLLFIMLLLIDMITHV